MGIVTKTLLSSLPQVAHLCLVIVVCMVLSAAVLTMALGHRSSAAHTFAASLNELFNGLLGGAELTLEAMYPDGMQQQRAQAFTAGLIYYLRDFLFIMVLMQFFMATIGAVFVAVKGEAQQRLRSAAGGSDVRLKGTIPHDLADHVWPEVLVAAKQALGAALRWCRIFGGKGWGAHAFAQMSGTGGVPGGGGSTLHIADIPVAESTIRSPAAGSNGIPNSSCKQLLGWFERAAPGVVLSSGEGAAGDQGIARGLAEPAIPAVILPASVLQELAAAEGVSLPRSGEGARLPLDLAALQGLFLKQLLLRGCHIGAASCRRDPAAAAAAVQEDLAALSAARSWLRKRRRQQQKQQQQRRETVESQASMGCNWGRGSVVMASSEAAGGSEEVLRGCSEAGGEAIAAYQDEQELSSLPPGWRSAAIAAVARCGDVEAVAGTMVVAGVLMKKLGVPVTGDAVADVQELLAAVGMLVPEGVGGNSGSWVEGTDGVGEGGQEGQHDGGLGEEGIGTELLLHAQIYGALWNAVAAMERWSLAVGRWSTRVILETNSSLASNAQILQQEQQQEGPLLLAGTGTAAADAQCTLVESLPDLQALLGGPGGVTQGYSVDSGELMQVALQYLQQEQQIGLGPSHSLLPGADAGGLAAAGSSSGNGVLVAPAALTATPLVGRRNLPPLVGPVPGAGISLHPEEEGALAATTSISSSSPSPLMQPLVVKSEADLFSQDVLSPTLEEPSLNSIPDSTQETELILATNFRTADPGATAAELSTASRTAGWESSLDGEQLPARERGLGGLRSALAARLAQCQPGGLGLAHASLSTLSGGGGSSTGSSSGIASPTAVGVKSKHWAWESNMGS